MVRAQYRDNTLGQPPNSVDRDSAPALKDTKLVSAAEPIIKKI